MNTPNFSALLDKPSTEIERPKPFPVGTYIAVVQGPPRHDKSTKKQTPFVEFTLKPIQALEDVDADDLEAFGGLGEKTIRDTYYITEDALWRLDDFLTNLGIEKDERSLRQRIDEAPGRQVRVTMKHEASQDGQSIFARVGGTAVVE